MSQMALTEAIIHEKLALLSSDAERHAFLARVQLGLVDANRLANRAALVSLAAALALAVRLIEPSAHLKIEEQDIFALHNADVYLFLANSMLYMFASTLLLDVIAKVGVIRVASEKFYSDLEPLISFSYGVSSYFELKTMARKRAESTKSTLRIIKYNMMDGSMAIAAFCMFFIAVMPVGVNVYFLISRFSPSGDLKDIAMIFAWLLVVGQITTGLVSMVMFESEFRSGS